MKVADPSFVALTTSRAIPASDIQELLKPKEAVWLQVTGENLTHLILVLKDRIEVASTELGKAELENRVESLRRGVEIDDEGLQVLEPFDVVSAYRLYQGLFEPLAADLADIDNLMAVFDGPMKNLPPALLLHSAAQAPAEEYGRFRRDRSVSAFEVFKNLDYLVRHLTISTLPSVGSLKALRLRFEAPSKRKPFAGFGAPTFEGGSTDRKFALPNKLPTSLDLETKRQLSRRFAPLSETELELEELAKVLEADRRNVFIGDMANETNIKSMSLEEFETIAFGTHVVVPSELQEWIDEPALIMPIPNHMQSYDDGILTESEVARLTQKSAI